MITVMSHCIYNRDVDLLHGAFDFIPRTHFLLFNSKFSLVLHKYKCREDCVASLLILVRIWTLFKILTFNWIVQCELEKRASVVSYCAIMSGGLTMSAAWMTVTPQKDCSMVSSSTGKHSLDKPKKHYKDTLKKSLKHCGILHSTWEESAENHAVWHSLVRSDVSNFEEKRIKDKEQKRQKRSRGFRLLAWLRPQHPMSQLQQIFQGQDQTHYSSPHPPHTQII